MWCPARISSMQKDSIPLQTIFMQSVYSVIATLVWFRWANQNSELKVSKNLHKNNIIA